MPKNILWSPRAGFNWDITGTKQNNFVEEQVFYRKTFVWIGIK
jgi:hypothetical protein